MFFYKFSVVLLFTFNTGSSLPVPDFQHKIDYIEKERIDVEHGLGEIPLLVDVQVQPVDGYYSNFYFPGVGTSTRDDDELIDYGCVIYSYNDKYIMISTPTKGNGRLGAAIFLQNSYFWDGQGVNYTSFNATVHIRAWRATALPNPDFVHTGTYMKANGLQNETYVEKQHHLGEYPGLVIVRLVSPNNNLILNAVGIASKKFIRGVNIMYCLSSQESQTSGATFSTFTGNISMNSYVVYGYDNSNIRVWTMDSEFGAQNVYYYARGDGIGFGYGDMPELTGTLEIYAWTISSLPPTFTTELSLGINDNIFLPEIQLPVLYDLRASMVKVTVQSLSGINEGYMFEGTGSMAYSDIYSPTSCRYGGLVYGYNESSITMWKPTDTYSGTLICISDMLAEGFNTQASHDGKAILNSLFINDINECESNPCLNQGTCVEGINMYTCFCADGYTGNDCVTDINECESNTCQNLVTCIDGPNMYTCICTEGYSGNECETDINECESSPCLNQGKCIDEVNMYSCLCTDDYTGYECETDMCEPIHSGGADIVFVVDTSISQTDDNVNKQKQFIQELITDMFDNKTTFQISLVTVNFKPVISFYLNSYSNKESLISAVDNIKFDKGPSYTGKALQLIHDEVLQSSNGARFINTNTFNTYVVVLSDGLSSTPSDTITRANELKQDGVVVIAMGIGTQICHEELLDIASDYSKVLFAGNDDLINYFFRYQVMDQCLDCYRGTSDVAVLMDASSNVNVQYFYVQLDALRQLVKASPIGHDRVHFSYAKFAEDVHTEFDFTDHLSANDILVALSTTNRLTQYSTAGDIAYAIKYMSENVFTPLVGHRTDARKFVVIFTNGKTENPNDIEQKALTLKESGVFVVTVGLGLDSNVTLLSRIASDPLYAYIIGDDAVTDPNVLTSLIGSFEFDVCDFD